MGVAPLLAPVGASLQVVSRAACFTWGSWSVHWPEGFEPPNPPAEDRELGWIADLAGEEPEPFGRCWVRADASIDAELGTSSVEDVLDAAQYRTSGEVFLEAEIPHENLAGQLPYVDFGVNSLVPLRLGGRILEDQLVTKVSESEDELGNRRTTVHVGGQKFQDREALRTANREIDRVIAQERLERGDEIGAKIAASQEYEREQRDNLKEYVDEQDVKVTEHADNAASTAETNAKTHAENEDRKLFWEIDERIGAEGTLTRQLAELHQNYEAKLGKNGTVIADQEAHQRMLSGIVYGKPVTELEGTAFKQQVQIINEMNAVFQDKQTTINKGFDFLFGLNEKINLAQDYTIAHDRILAESRQAHDFEIQISTYGDRLVRQSVNWDNSGVIGQVTRFENGFVDVQLNGARAYGLLRAWVNGVTFHYAHAASNGLVLHFSFDWALIKDFENTIYLNGTLFPQDLLPKYQKQIAKLQAEYRAKGLRV